MAKKQSFAKEIEKKKQRRKEELDILKSHDIRLHSPQQTKKPMEFSFDRDKKESFRYPVAIGNTTLEKKSDGFCVHISVDRKKSEKVKLYSSGQNEWDPRCFPEINKDLEKMPSGYYHGEILGTNPGNSERFTSLDEFTAIENRPKTNIGSVTAELVEKYPLKIDIFDVLLLEGKRTLMKPLWQRRRSLEQKIAQTGHLGLISRWETEDEAAMQKVFLSVVSKGYEGLIAKDPESLYVPGSRDNDWIKLKNFTTLDLAVLGFYETEESSKAGKHFSAMLVGSYNSETGNFETLAKVKVGKAEDQEEIWARANRKIKVNEDYDKLKGKSRNILVNESIEGIKRKLPSTIVRYENDEIAIVEVQILNVTYSENWHSCGIGYGGKNAHSLRIPTFKQLRKDKSGIKDITTTSQIHNYYTGQN